LSPVAAQGGHMRTGGVAGNKRLRSEEAEVPELSLLRKTNQVCVAFHALLPPSCVHLLQYALSIVCGNGGREVTCLQTTPENQGRGTYLLLRPCTHGVLGLPHSLAADCALVLLCAAVSARLQQTVRYFNSDVDSSIGSGGWVASHGL
jgi:hypothetical protein